MMRRAWYPGCRVVMALCGVLGWSAGALGQVAGRSLFVGSSVDGIERLPINEDGTLGPVEVTTTGRSTGPLALSPSGRWLAVVSRRGSEPDEFSIMAVHPDGRLTPSYNGTLDPGTNDIVWVSDELLVRSQYRSDAHRLATHRWNETDGTCSEVHRQDSSGGGALLYRADVGQIYAVGTLAGGIHTVTRWTIDDDGSLDAAQFVATHVHILDPVLTPDGRFLLAAGGNNTGEARSVHAIALSPTGEMAWVPGSPFQSPGYAPWQLGVRGDGRYLVVGHYDHEIRTFSIGQEGSLQDTGASFSVGNGRQIKVWRDTAYVADLGTAGGIWAVRVGEAGSLTPMGAPAASHPNSRRGSLVIWDPSALCPADFNGDTRLDSGDISAFLTQWLADLGEDGYADFDGSGEVNSADISAFLTAWLAALGGHCE